MEKHRFTLGSLRWFVLALVLAILVQGAFIFFLPTGGDQVFSTSPQSLPKGIFTVLPLDSRTVAVVTLDNRLSIRQNGTVLAQTDVPGTVQGIVYRTEPQEIVVGASNGRLCTYDRSLNQSTETMVRGGVLGLALLPQNHLAVAHGIGAFGDRFYVSPLDGQGETRGTYQVGRRITALDSVGDRAIYGTYDAHVGAVALDGTLQWDVQVKREVSAVKGWVARDHILVGDVVGNVYLFDHDGVLVWETHPTQFRISAIEPLADGTIVVGDSDGELYLLSADGRTLLAQPTRNQRDPVVVIYQPDQGRIEAVRQSGLTVAVDLQSLVNARWSKALRPIRYGVSSLTLVLLLVTLIHAVERWRTAVYRTLRRIYRARTAYLFLLPSFSLIVVFVYLTTAMAIFYSTTDYIPGGPMRFVGLQNFTTIFTADHYFWLGFGNMVLILVTSVFKVLTMPLAVALLIFHLRNARAQYGFRTAVLLPSVVPAIVLTMMWKMMYDPGTTGFFNALLRALNLPHLQRAWLGDERTALWAIIFSGFPWVSAFSFLIYLGGLININPELFDAGAIDGVNWWGRLRHIEWPLLAPQRNLLLFFTYLGAIQSYEGIWVYTQGGPGTATYVPALQLYLNLSQGMKVGYASAIGFVLFLMVLSVTILNRRMQRPVEVQ